MNKKIIYRIIFTISCLVFVVCAALLIKIYLPENSNMEEYKNETTTSVVTETTAETTAVVLPDNPINFKKLHKVNPDVYAWIQIPDTNIDYAVAQAPAGEDDFFYLNHNIEGNYEFAGSIYSEQQNAKDFSDFVTVLYGHNMKNGSMFNHLHKFEDAKFFKKHKTFYVYTPGHILTYTVVSAYVYDDRHILNTFDFSKKADKKEYIESLTNPRSLTSNVRENISVTVKDKILTLSTCTSSDSQRYLVQGVLTDDTITK